jgi:hypothetical protein
LLTVGFWEDDVYVFGPLQLHVTGTMLVVDALSVNGLPEQTGLLELAIGVAGVSLITTFVVPADEVQPLIVTVTLYVPVAKTEALAIVGF